MKRSWVAWCALSAAAGAVFGEVHPGGVPALSSRPGSAYTVYLDFAGFTFTGVWVNSGTPGVTPAYNNVTGSFGAADQATITNVWAWVAEKFAPFNINVTTIDPAVAAGQAGSDAQRQAYYDATAKLMHTVIADDCTGCELCVPACPVDCIVLLPMPETQIDMAHADAARAHFQRREARLEHLRVEREVELATRKAAVGDGSAQRNQVLEALARAKAKQQEPQS